MSSDITIGIEPADSEDALACLSQYYAELAQRFEEGFDASQGNPPDASEMSKPHGAFAIARRDGVAVGCGALKSLGDGAGEIKRVWVSKNARGQHLASQLMDVLEREAVALGFSVLRLDTNKALSEAQTMYAKRGYKPIPRYNDNPYAHHWFEKVLAPNG